MSDGHGKLTEIHSFRIPYQTKEMIDVLPPEGKAELNNELRLTIAKLLHKYKFDPEVYLGE